MMNLKKKKYLHIKGLLIEIMRSPRMIIPIKFNNKIFTIRNIKKMIIIMSKMTIQIIQAMMKCSNSLIVLKEKLILSQNMV